MSTFTYACPICHQHLKCDSSQAGAIMKCSTCYQRVIAPQAPSQADSKLILTGLKYVEKNLPAPAAAAAKPRAPEKSGAPVALLAAGIGALVVLAGAFLIYHFMSAPSWEAADIGRVSVPGSFRQAGGVFELHGSGADIFGQKDEFYFVFQPLTGDGALTARLVGMKNTDVWAKAGVMILDNRGTGAPFAATLLRPDGQALGLWRSGVGKVATRDALAGGPGLPKWLKVERAGRVCTMSIKANAEANWTVVGQQAVDLSAQVRIGLAVCAHNPKALCEARFDQVALTRRP